MDDSISRQAAIDILDAYQVMVENGEENPYAWARLRMSELPSAQPEQRWIPCSEMLPDEYGEYLVTKHTIGWNCEEYVSNDIAYFDNDGFHKADTVIAWMPLPEPYRTERRTDGVDR